MDVCVWISEWEYQRESSERDKDEEVMGECRNESFARKLV